MANFASETIEIGGQKIPAWVAIAAAGGALLLVVIGGASKNRDASTSGTSSDLINAEMQQRLQEDKATNEKSQAEMIARQQEYQATMKSQWDEFKAFMLALFNSGNAPGSTTPTPPVSPPSTPPPADPGMENLPLPPRPSTPPIGLPPGKKGGYSTAYDLSAQFGDNSIYGLSPILQTGVLDTPTKRRFTL